ncbi:MAG: hypothetical protein RLY70_4159 [Planctomycetota bacterium]
MKTVPASARPRPSAWAIGAAPLGWLLVLALVLPMSAGCSGCRSNNAAAKKKAEEEEKAKKDAEEQLKLKKKKELPDYELTKLTSYPDDPDQVQNFVKPGHWVTMTEQLRANNFDMSAEFELSATDSDSKPYLVEQTDFHLRLARPIGLPKGQARTLELTTYVPREARNEQSQEIRRVWFDGRLLAARSGKLLGESREATTAMQPYENFLIVLAREPNDYRYIKVLDSIAPPAFDAEGSRRFHYRVVIPPVDQFVPLPSHPLTWTSIAYVFWDGIDPNLLSSEQQQALLDWIHWGGQLIISGPGSLDRLKNSFLDPFLPADSDGSRDLEPDDLKAINDYWTLPSTKQPNLPRTLATPGGRPLLGVTLALRPEGTFLPNTGDLVCERRVGGGRVVVTALPCGDESIRVWRSFDNFLNGCLLRRPGRDFSPLSNLSRNFAEPVWIGRQVSATDARMLSTLRYLTRDYGSKLDEQRGEAGDANPANPNLANPKPENGSVPAIGQTSSAPGQNPNPPVDPLPAGAQVDAPASVPAGTPFGTPPPFYTPNRPYPRFLSESDMRDHERAERERGLYSDEVATREDYRFRGASRDAHSGVAGWNDTSGTAVAVRKIVSEAAGINIPDARFILKMMAIYLTLLVPVNWLVFRLIGRVEWAWIAVPIFAVVGAVAVIRLAQLDVGFVRSRREIAVLETQGGYDRGHLTRYNLLYASLSTGYDVTFSDPSAVAQPISKGIAPQMGMYAAARNVSFRRDDAVRISDFLVMSNSAELLHSEQMLPLGGPMELLGSEESGWELHHHGELSLREVGIVRRTAPNQYEAAWLGDLAARSQTKLDFQPLPRPDPWINAWESSSTMRRAGSGESGEINLGRLADLALRRMVLGVGDVRLVGWTGDELPGIQFSPVAAQNASRTLIVCHLRRGPWPAIERDINVRLDHFSIEEAGDPDDPGSAESSSTDNSDSDTGKAAP